jgi:hypothetical protein
MSDKELIKQEIERRFNDNMKASEQYTENSKNRALFTSAAKEDYDLLAFIDSLPEKPASEDLEEEIKKVYLQKRERGGTMNMLVILNQREFENIAHHFAEWQKQAMKEVLQTEYEKGRFDMREEMMKDAVETTIVNDWQYGKDPDHTIIPAIHQRIEGFNVGDKVKIIIIKEEQK